MVCFPFSAIIDQEHLKKALILAAISPDIGGILIRGEVGTAKSTAVRALTNLLPEIKTFPGCPYNCDPDAPETLCPKCREIFSLKGKMPIIERRIPLVELPVSATEDRVVGSLDFEAVIAYGERRFLPGLIAAANRGILYIDEVNLLDDHIVNFLLDAAASGFNVAEREGVSYIHPASFILVGTMNPEEGELRPQLLDRFGLCVEIEGIGDPLLRVEIIKRRVAYEKDPRAFATTWEPEQIRLRDKIAEAKALLPKVKASEEALLRIAEIAIELGVDGHRADIVILKAAKTIAAFCSNGEVTEEHIREAASLALPHRMRRRPFEEMGTDLARLDVLFQKWGR